MGFLLGLLELIGLFVVAVYRFAHDVSSDGQRTWTFRAPAQGDPTYVPTGRDWTTVPPPEVRQRVHTEVEALQQIDPDFNEFDFLARAGETYQSYLACDAEMNADGMSSIATPDCVAAYRASVAKWKDAGLRRVVRDTKMLGSALIRVMVAGSRQAIVVRFISSGVRFTQEIDTGVAVDGSPQPDTFNEFVTFVRPANTTTPKSSGAGGATHCPSCGAPTTAGDATCPFCGSQLTGTGGTWLLDHISATAYS